MSLKPLGATEFQQLEEIIRHHLNPVEGCVNYDVAQVDDLVSFLHALTDLCVTDAVCLEPWLPFPGEDDFDTNHLMAQILAVEK